MEHRIDFGRANERRSETFAEAKPAAARLRALFSAAAIDVTLVIDGTSTQIGRFVAANPATAGKR